MSSVIDLDRTEDGLAAAAERAASAEQAWLLRDDDHQTADAVAAALIAGEARDVACAAGHIILGYLRQRDELFDIATKHLLEAQKLLDVERATPWVARVFGNQGAVYLGLGEYVLSYECFQKQLNYALEHGFQEEECIALHDIGCYFIHTHEFDRAIQYFHKSSSRNNGDVAMICFLQMSLSECAIGQRQFELAVYHAGKAVETATVNNLVRALSFSQIALGNALSSSGDHEGAEYWFDQASKFKGRPDLTNVESALLASEAVLKRGRASQAIENLGKLAEQIASSGSKRNAMRWHRLLSKAHRTMGNFEEALTHHEQFHEYHQAIFSESSETKARALDLIYRTDALRRESELLQQQNDALNRHVGELSALNNRIKELSLRDPLTGLFNRRHLFQSAGKLFLEAREGRGSIGVVMLDLDHFKKINDTFGHKIGDDVLIQVARLLEQQVRPGDLVARYGGEEFTILMEDMPIAAAEQVCERIRVAIASQRWQDIHPDLAVSASIGLACAAGVASDDGLFVWADKQLYKAKNLGRNRVVASIYGQDNSYSAAASAVGGRLM